MHRERIITKELKALNFPPIIRISCVILKTFNASGKNYHRRKTINFPPIVRRLYNIKNTTDRGQWLNVLKEVTERIYLEEHRRLWKSQNIEEGRNHFCAERVWRHQCYLREAWEVQKGTRRGRTHHALRKLSSPTWEKDQSPSSSCSLFQWTRRLQIEKKKILEFVCDMRENTANIYKSKCNRNGSILVTLHTSSKINAGR